LGSKQEWRTFMEPPATQADSFLWDRCQVWGGECVVCGTDMARGVGDHVPSQSHWKCLWNKLGQQVPAPDAACKWEQPWVQRFSTVLGTYLFNHVTGQHGLEANLCASSMQEEHQTLEEFQPIRPESDNGVPGPPQAESNKQNPQDTPAPPQADCKHQMPPVSSQQVNGNRFAAEKFDLPAWVWQRYICMGALELDRMLSEHGTGVAPVCKVCEVALGPPASEHLSSPGHFRCLTARLSDAKTEDVCTRLDAGVWVQELSVASGNTLLFNHLTGQVQCAKV